MSQARKVNRRTAMSHLTWLASGAVIAGKSAAAEASPREHAAETKPTRKSGIGVVMYDCNLRRRWMRARDSSFDLFDPMNFLQHCHALGAGGVQMALGILTEGESEALAKFANEQGMFIESIVQPPKDRDDLIRFDAEIKSARDAGALAARTVIIPGRRYEHFKTFAEFQMAAKLGHAMVQRAVPVVEKYEVPLAIENHKDERIEQRVELLDRINSPYIGACVDTGNSFSLLDDVYATMEALAPFACSVHFKDQALAEYDDGFLLGDIPLGQGSFDLHRIKSIIRNAKPDLQFCLEILTRDALKVPCLTTEYWKCVTEPSGPELASALRFVRKHQTSPIAVSKLPLAEQVAQEDANVAASLDYAGQELGL